MGRTSGGGCEMMGWIVEEVVQAQTSFGNDQYKLETTLNCMVDFEPQTTGLTIPTYDCTRQHSKLRGHKLSDSLTVLRDIVQ